MKKSIYYKQIPARHAKENNINQKSLYQKVDWYSAFSPHMYLRKKKNKDEIY